MSNPLLVFLLSVFYRVKIDAGLSRHGEFWFGRRKRKSKCPFRDRHVLMDVAADKGTVDMQRLICSYDG
jgi:hypothetical protein